MPDKQYATLMARYNLWQNHNLISAADSLENAARKQDRGAFFGSIAGTFSHLLWGDQVWLSRFGPTKEPDISIAESGTWITEWAEFKRLRAETDQIILNWADTVEPDWFEGDLVWFSGAVNREMSRPKSVIATQFFNHLTHHRGQIHAMLTAAGAKPGDTDVPFMPDEYVIFGK